MKQREKMILLPLEAENKILDIRWRKSTESNTKGEVKKKRQSHGVAIIQSEGIKKK